MVMAFSVFFFGGPKFEAAAGDNEVRSRRGVRVLSGPAHVLVDDDPPERRSNAPSEATDDSERDYQAVSVESWGIKAKQGIAWIKERLTSINITPSRLLLGLGLLGILYTWNKNKQKVPWAVLSLFSALLVLFGVCAMVFHWPSMN